LQRLRAYRQKVEKAARQLQQGLAPRGGRQDRARDQERVQKQEEGSEPRGDSRQARVQEKTRVQTKKEEGRADEI